jgi:hypothetical protein
MKVVFFKSVLIHRQKLMSFGESIQMPEYKKLLQKQNENSLDSTSDDSKREIEMALDMEGDVSPLLGTGTLGSQTN